VYQSMRSLVGQDPDWDNNTRPLRTGLAQTRVGSVQALVFMDPVRL
jgi:hypothetical protein